MTTYDNIVCTISDLNVISILSNFTEGRITGWAQFYNYCQEHNLQHNGMKTSFHPHDFGFSCIALAQKQKDKTFRLVKKPMSNKKFSSYAQVILIMFEDDDLQKLTMYREKIIKQLQKLAKKYREQLRAGQEADIFHTYFDKNIAIPNDVPNKTPTIIRVYLNEKFSASRWALQVSKINNFKERFQQFLNEQNDETWEWWAYFCSKAKILHDECIELSRQLASNDVNILRETAEKFASSQAAKLPNESIEFFATLSRILHLKLWQSETFITMFDEFHSSSSQEKALSLDSRAHLLWLNVLRQIQSGQITATMLRKIVFQARVRGTMCYQNQALHHFKRNVNNPRNAFSSRGMRNQLAASIGEYDESENLNTCESCLQYLNTSGKYPFIGQLRTVMLAWFITPVANIAVPTPFSSVYDKLREMSLGRRSTAFDSPKNVSRNYLSTLPQRLAAIIDEDNQLPPLFDTILNRFSIAADAADPDVVVIDSATPLAQRMDQIEKTLDRSKSNAELNAMQAEIGNESLSGFKLCGPTTLVTDRFGDRTHYPIIYCSDNVFRSVDEPLNDMLLEKDELKSIVLNKLKKLPIAISHWGLEERGNTKESLHELHKIVSHEWYNYCCTKFETFKPYMTLPPPRFVADMTRLETLLNMFAEETAEGVAGKIWLLVDRFNQLTPALKSEFLHQCVTDTEIKNKIIEYFETNENVRSEVDAVALKDAKQALAGKIEFEESSDLAICNELLIYLQDNILTQCTLSDYIVLQEHEYLQRFFHPLIMKSILDHNEERYYKMFGEHITTITDTDKLWEYAERKEKKLRQSFITYRQCNEKMRKISLIFLHEMRSAANFEFLSSIFPYFDEDDLGTEDRLEDEVDQEILSGAAVQELLTDWQHMIEQHTSNARDTQVQRLDADKGVSFTLQLDTSIYDPEEIDESKFIFVLKECIARCVNVALQLTNFAESERFTHRDIKIARIVSDDTETAMDDGDTVVTSYELQVTLPVYVNTDVLFLSKTSLFQQKALSSFFHPFRAPLVKNSIVDFFTIESYVAKCETELQKIVDYCEKMPSATEDNANAAETALEKLMDSKVTSVGFDKWEREHINVEIKILIELARKAAFEPSAELLALRKKIDQRIATEEDYTSLQDLESKFIKTQRRFLYYTLLDGSKFARPVLEVAVINKQGINREHAISDDDLAFDFESELDSESDSDQLVVLKDPERRISDSSESESDMDVEADTSQDTDPPSGTSQEETDPTEPTKKRKYDELRLFARLKM